MNDQESGDGLPNTGLPAASFPAHEQTLFNVAAPEAVKSPAVAHAARRIYADVDAMVPDCQGCQRCALGQTRRNAAVYRGNPYAPLMLIGEGPGEQEDEQGKPFVGPAGQHLDKILRAGGFDPDQDTFICNVVKCRPPGNRNPEPDEVIACRPFLMEQIRLVAPRMFVFVGAVALRGCTGEQRGITKARGQWFTWQERPAIAIFHPSYLLRSPSREKGSPSWWMWQDIKAIRTRWEAMQAEDALDWGLG